MRLLGSIGLVASLALAPRIALAKGDHHSAPEVHDHRSGSSSDSGHSAPVVHDHRSPDSSSSTSTPVVRDHRSSSSGGTYVEPEPEVIIDDSGAPEPTQMVQLPSFTFEVGGLARRFTGPVFSRSGTVDTTSGTSAGYGLESGAPTAGDTAGGEFEMRMTAPFTNHLYLGAEIELGGITRSPVKLMTTEPNLHLSRGIVGTTAVVGARARHGRTELDGEVAGGMRILLMNVASVDAGEDDPAESETSVSAIVEARLRGVLWVSNHVYVAAQAGVGVLDQSDVNVGFALGFSTHLFGDR